MPDLPLILIELLFGVLFVWALWTAIRHRSALARDVTLVFVPLAALMAGTLATQLLEALGAEEATLPTWVGIAVVTLLLLQPVFSLKLVADLREIPRWLLPATLAGVVATTALFVATQPTPPTWILFAVVGVFIAGQVVAAMYLLDEARHRTCGHGRAATPSRSCRCSATGRRSARSVCSAHVPACSTPTMPRSSPGWPGGPPTSSSAARSSPRSNA